MCTETRRVQWGDRTAWTRIVCIWRPGWGQGSLPNGSGPPPQPMVLSAYSPDSPERLPLLSPVYITPTVQDLTLLPPCFPHLLEVHCAPPTISFLLHIPPREIPTRTQNILCWPGTNLKSKALLLLFLSDHFKHPHSPHTHLLALAGSPTGSPPTTHMLACRDLPPALCLPCLLSCTHLRRLFHKNVSC